MSDMSTKVTEVITAKEYREKYCNHFGQTKPHKPTKKRVSNKGITQMKLLLTIEKIEFVTEYRFHPTRKWRFDIAIISKGKKIALEYEGIFGGGKSRHTTQSGFVGDAEKYNEAAKLGWTVLRYTAAGYSKCIDDVRQLL